MVSFQLIRKKWAELAFTLVLFGLVAGVLVSRAAGVGLSHDEFQFVAGAQLFKTGGLLPYRNYPFLHMPYMPIFYGVFLFLGQYDLFLARLANELCIFLSAAFLFFFTTRLFQNTKAVFRLGMGAFAVLLLLANSSLMSTDGRAMNHGLPTLLSLGAFWACWRAAENRPSGRGPAGRGLGLFFCGVLAGAAVGTRLNYAVLIVPILFAIFCDPFFKDRKEQLRSLVSFCAGGLAALLPVGVLFLLAPKPFIYGNLHYIALNTLYRKNLGYAISMDLGSKLVYFSKNVLLNPENMALYLAWLGLLVAAAIRWARSRERDSYLVLLPCLFGLVLLASGFAPTPLWPQYFFGPVPFLLIGVMLGAVLLVRDQRVILSASLALLLAMLVINPPISGMLAQAGLLAQPQQWVTTQMHELGEEIRAQSGCTQNCKVLTLVPILPLEADLDTYPVFAVGSFSWRTAPFLSKARRAEYGVISYDDLAEFLARDPPAAILTGTEASYDGFTRYDPGGLDQPFVDYAQSHHFRPIKIADTVDDQGTSLTLWVK